MITFQNRCTYRSKTNTGKILIYESSLLGICKNLELHYMDVNTMEQVTIWYI